VRTFGAGNFRKGAASDAAHVRAPAAHKDFLTEDAHSGIPILKKAKAEYAQLQ